MARATQTASLQLVDSLAACDRHAWNALNTENQPFLSYDFLYALEQHACIGQHYGWLPGYLLLKRRQKLLAATPIYSKSNSYGEFVFDYEWAEAWHAHGLDYYPKLVSCVPYTPVSGARLLSGNKADQKALINGAMKISRDGYSGVHWLFFTDDVLQKERRLAKRLGCQYHWHNPGYQSFSDFLDALTARRRKTIRQERKKVQAQNFHCEVLHGDEIDPDLWPAISALYQSTFDRKWGLATLNENFFRELAQRMPKQIVVFLARLKRRLSACSICFRDHQTLYGRYWGCTEVYDCLHFELCYYMGIEYCIKHRLKRFEPGAQGEYKILRGFLPAPTWSAHWIRHPDLAPVVQDFCQREETLMRQRMSYLYSLSPYRTGTVPSSRQILSSDGVGSTA